MKNARFKPEWMAYTGLLVAMQVVLGSWVQVPLPWKQFNFGFLPVAVAGALLGAPSAMIVGGLGDFIGTHLSSTGAYDPRFSITWLIVGLLYGLFLHDREAGWKRVGLCSLLVCCVNLFLNTFWLLIYIPKGYGALLATRWWTYLPEAVLQTAVIVLSLGALRRVPFIKALEQKEEPCKQSNETKSSPN